MHQQHHERSRAPYSQPGWLSKLLSQSSQKYQQSKGQQSIDAIFGVNGSAASSAVALLSVKEVSLQSAPVKLERKFSLMSRKDKKVKSAKNSSHTASKEASASLPATTRNAPYSPTHAGSDFGKLLVTNTHRNNRDSAYNDSSVAKHQDDRHSESKEIHPAPCDDAGSDHFLKTSSLPPLSPVLERKHRGGVSLQDIYTQLQSTNSPLVEPNPMRSEDRTGEPCTAAALSEFDVTAALKNRHKHIIPLSHQQRLTSRHTPQAHMPEPASSSPSASLLPFAAHRGSFTVERYQRPASRQMPARENEKNGLKRRHSVIVSLGVKVSEYVRPTLVKDNSLPTMPQLAG